MPVPVWTSVGLSSPVRRWLQDAAFALVSNADDAKVVVFDPRDGPPSPHHAAPCVAVLPLDDADQDMVHPDSPRFVEMVADAYAGDARGLQSAVSYVVQPRPAPSVDPWITYVGGLGTPATATAVGTTVALDERRTIGRSSCDLLLRQGAHSDQNIVARRHALIEPTAAGPVAHDLGSTNGTWVHGQPIDAPMPLQAPVDVVISGCLHLRLGVPRHSR